MPTKTTAHPPKSNGKSLAQERRQARLAAELRANLRKRKDQARGRADQEETAGGRPPDRATGEVA